MPNVHEKKNLTASAFESLGQEKQLQEYSSILYKMMGLVIDFASANGETLRLSQGKNFNPFCTMLRKTPSGRDACHDCDVRYARQAAEQRCPLCYTCYAGLQDIILPLYDTRGEYIGSLTSGQYHLDGAPRLNKRQIARLACEYDLDAQILWKYYQNSITLTEQQVEGILSYLKIIGQHLTSVREHLIFMEKINTPKKLESVRKYVTEHCCDRLTVADVARKFFISPDYLAHQFSAQVNLPFHRYVLFCRLAKAKSLLMGSHLAIKEIALSCGFGSLSQFNRLFQQENGMTPSQFRVEKRDEK